MVGAGFAVGADSEGGALDAGARTGACHGCIALVKACLRKAARSSRIELSVVSFFIAAETVVGVVGITSQAIEGATNTAGV